MTSLPAPTGWAEFSDLRIDLRDGVVCHLSGAAAGTCVRLQPRALALLRCLIEHRGRMMTHEQLLDTCWPGLDVQPEVLKTQIAILRKALGDTANRPRFIEAIRLQGYRFLAEPLTGARMLTAAGWEPGRFVGREDAIERLQGILATARKGSCEVAFVIGEPGMGKTRLIHRFREEAEACSQAIVSEGACVQTVDGLDSFHPVLVALGVLLRNPQAARLRSLFLDLAPHWAAQLPGLGRAGDLSTMHLAAGGRMIREFIAVLDALPAGPPIMLVLEDLHWADSWTSALLSAVAGRQCATGVLLIATFRPEDAALGAHPVQAAASALRTKHLAHIVELEALDRSALEAMVASGPLDDWQRSFASLIADWSGGNPLFIVSTIEDFEQRGLIAKGCTGWTRAATYREADLPIPVSLRDHVASRMTLLSDDERAVLRGASLVGRTFDSGLAAIACGLDEPSFVSTCRSLSAQGRFIHFTGTHAFPDGSASACFAFRHEMYRVAIHDAVDEVQARAANEAIAARIRHRYPDGVPGEVSPRLAEHCAAAGDWTAALLSLEGVLADSRARYGLELPIMIEPAISAEAEGRSELAFLEARATLHLVRRSSCAARYFDDLARRAHDSGLIELKVKGLLGLSQAQRVHDRDAGRRTLDQALATAALVSDQTARAHAVLGCLVLIIQNHGWDGQIAEQARIAAASLLTNEDAVIRANAAVEYCQIAILAGRYREVSEAMPDAIETLSHMDRNHRPAGAERALVTAQYLLSWSLLYLGELERAISVADHGIAHHSRSAEPQAASVLRIMRAHCWRVAGDLDKAWSDCLAVSGKDEARSLRPEVRMYWLVVSGMVAAGRGDLARTVSLFDEAERFISDEPASLDWYCALLLAYARSQLWLAVGDAGLASPIERMTELAARWDEPTLRMLTLDTLACARLRTDDLPGARRSNAEAFEAGRGFETPLSTWRLHLTAETIQRRLNRPREAEAHRQAALRELDALIGASVAGGAFHQLLSKTFGATALMQA